MNKLNIKELIEKYKYILLLIVIILEMSLLNYHFDDSSFYGHLINNVFLFFIVNLPFTLLCFLFLKKRHFVYSIISSVILTMPVMYLFASPQYLELYNNMNKLFDNVLVKPLAPFNFVIASVSGGSSVFVLVISGFVGLFLLIYGNWFLKNKKIDDLYDTVQRKVIYTGIGVYGIINILIWVFTHFAFVSSNYLYMGYNIRIIDQIATHYQEKDKTEFIKIKELKYFSNIEDVLFYYYYDAGLSDNKKGVDKEQNFKTMMNTIKMLKESDFKYSPTQVNYDSMKRFHDWVSIAYNFSYNKNENQTYWMLELTPVNKDVLKDNEIKPKDVARHSMLFIKKTQNNGYYTYLVQDRTFKENKMNYIFNSFYILFHILYISLFIYLCSIHRKKQLNKGDKNG